MITYHKLTKAQHVLLKVTVRDYVNILFRVCLFSRIRQLADKIRERETCVNSFNLHNGGSYL